MALNSAIQPYAFDGLARFSWRLHSQLNINLNGIIVNGTSCILFRFQSVAGYSVDIGITSECNSHRELR
ncbi:Integrin beta-like protein [Trichinella spiralis]|uniref:Integrin beta-like protein n=1 Tax=Trichinella spiralis TaxID=6334 RepID=A0ABR3KEL2_TRISP